MGVHLKELVEPQAITLESLGGKTLAFDAYNLFYQFLSSIRQPDGTPLKDSSGHVTSILVGLSTRIPHFLENNITPVFILDGVPPPLKQREIERRRDQKEQAGELYEKARSEGDVAGMFKYAKRTSALTKEMIESAVALLHAMGVPTLKAPSEGEAQAARMVRDQAAWAVISQDMDSLLYGAPRMVRNLSIYGKRKLPGKLTYTTISPELIELEKFKHSIGLDQDQLIVLGILIGTDFNIAGIKGIGPKKGLKLLLTYQHDFDGLFRAVEWEKHYTLGWQEVFTTIKNIPTTGDYTVKSLPHDPHTIQKILLEDHDFSVERVNALLHRTEKLQSQSLQKGLGDYW